jgi:hypothetical protein
MSASQEVRVGGGYCGPDYLDGMKIVPGPCFPELSDIAISGEFAITGNTCPARLNSGGMESTLSCSVFVAFAPAGAGSEAGFLRVASGASIVGVPLSGTGLVCFRTAEGKRVCSATARKKKRKHKKKHHKHMR